jgi:hypothetical protein
MPALLAARAEGLLDAAEEQWVATQARQCPGCAQLMTLADRGLKAFQSALAGADAHPWLPRGITTSAPSAPGAAAGDDPPGNAWLPRTG